MTVDQWTAVFEEVATVGMHMEDAAEAVLQAILDRITPKDIEEFHQGHSLQLANALEAAKDCLGIEGDDSLLMEFPAEGEEGVFFQGWHGPFIAFELNG
jgi:hypothetical protein